MVLLASHTHLPLPHSSLCVRSNPPPPRGGCEYVCLSVHRPPPSPQADAKRDAAANALAFLQQHPLFKAQQQQQAPLEEVTDACTANQVGGARVQGLSRVCPGAHNTPGWVQGLVRCTGTPGQTDF